MAITLEPIYDEGLVALAVARRAILGSDDDHAYDDLLAGWIVAASTAFEAQTAQAIRSGTLVREYTGNGSGELRLRYWPVTAVASVERRIAVDTWEAVDTSTYELHGSDRVYALTSWMGWGRGARYRVTMTVGHATVPMDVQEIITEAARHKWLDNGTHFGGGRAGKASDGFSGAPGEKNITTTYDRDTFPREWAKVVGRYQKLSTF